MNTNCEIEPRPKSLKEFFKSSFFWKPFLSVVIGSILGFAYFWFVGCKSGACAITSNPLSSIITGGLLGFLLTGSPCIKCNSRN